MAKHMADLKEQQKKKVEEVENQFKKKLERAQQKLAVFERATEFELILQTYNDQMSSLENENSMLVSQVKNIAQCSQKLDLPEVTDKVLQYNFNKIQVSLKKLTENHEKCMTELQEFRKKERIFNLHKRCAEDTTKKLQNHGKKLNDFQQDLADKNSQISVMKAHIENMEVDMKNYHTIVNKLEDQKSMYQQEIQLLKDYTYGIDPRAKDVHMHKFLNKGKSRNDLSVNNMLSDLTMNSQSSLKPSNCQSCGAMSNIAPSNMKSAGKGFGS